MRSKMKTTALDILGICLFFFCGLVLAQDIPKPAFPDVFQTEVQGIFQNELVEVDGSLYYDRKNNRAAMFYTFQNVTTRSIFKFNTDEMIYIDGNDCSVSEINQDTFFPFTVDKNKRKTIGSPEEVLYFTNSKLERQDISVLPVYIFTANIDIPQYGRKNCKISHVFSKPEIELPNCESHACMPTLMAISVQCNNDKGEVEVDHTYNFYRFRSGIKDESVFMPPVGVHCELKDNRDFPPFPPYFSFSYDITEKLKDSTDDTVYTTHKKVWYDSEFRLVRIDEYDDGGQIQATRVFDVIAKSAYTIIATLPTCDMGPIMSRIEFDQITRLPRIFFSQNSSRLDTAVYVGKRTVHGLAYDVWSLSWTDAATDAMIVEEVYFIKTAPNIEPSSDTEKQKDYWRISHAYIYTYEENDQSGIYELSLLTYLSVNNFRSKMKELGAFDVATCFGKDQKRVFKLKVTGPPIVRGSHFYLEAMELLERKILAKTKVSVLRISELTGTFDGIYLSEVWGYILDSSAESGWKKNTSAEPGMNETYNLIKEAALAGDLSFVLDEDKSLQYNVTYVSEDKEIIKKEEGKSCYSGVTMAVACVILLLIGVAFGSAGYYVFLKKRKAPSSDRVQLHPVDFT